MADVFHCFYVWHATAENPETVVASLQSGVSLPSGYVTSCTCAFPADMSQSVCCGKAWRETLSDR